MSRLEHVLQPCLFNARPATLAQERMEAIRREQDAAEVAECSFRPQINPKSARMVEQRQQILRVRGGGRRAGGRTRGAWTFGSLSIWLVCLMAQQQQCWRGLVSGGWQGLQGAWASAASKAAWFFCACLSQLLAVPCSHRHALRAARCKLAS